MGGDPPEDSVFGDALPGRPGVVYRVTGAAVEEPLVPAGGAGGEIPFFDEQRRDAAGGVVERERREPAAANESPAVSLMID